LHSACKDIDKLYKNIRESQTFRSNKLTPKIHRNPLNFSGTFHSVGIQLLIASRRECLLPYNCLLPWSL